MFLKTSGGLVPVQPVVSNVVKDKKAYTDLQVRQEKNNYCFPYVSP